MISQNRIRTYIKSLLAKTASRLKESQNELVPIYLETTMNVNNAITGKHTKLSVINTDRYRYNSKWYSYKYSAESPSETFGILKIDNIFTTKQINEITSKYFIGTVNSLVYKNLIKPFMLMLDGKIVPWDIMELVYDSDDIWLILRGDKYNHYALDNISKVNIILWPFSLEYIGTEPDKIFNLRYNILVDYMQSNVKYKDGKFYIMSPTLSTEWEYNGTMYNIGGWAYEQMKLYKLGSLSDDKIDKLRKIRLDLVSYDNSGNVSTIQEVKYNLLDRDVPTDAELYNYAYGLNETDYKNTYDNIAFDSDGLFSNDGVNKFYITNKDIITRRVTIDDNYIWDISDIAPLIFRENFIVFANGLYNQSFEILSSVNNMTLLPNPDNNDITVILFYNKHAESCISNASKFNKEYINTLARNYLQALLTSSQTDPSLLPNTTSDLTDNYNYVDAITEDGNKYSNITTINDEIVHNDEKSDFKAMEIGTITTLENRYKAKLEDLGTTTLNAQEISSNAMFRNLSFEVISEDATAIPSVLDYVVFIMRTTKSEEEALDIISRITKILDFNFDNRLSFNTNLDNAIESIIDYDVSLLTPLYHTGVDSVTITGKKANEALEHTFMYESRRGLKIPRKRYKNHETYFMMFVNGELFEDYYRTIAYSNFFFIPIEDNFSFNDNDIIEILYIKNVNNNEFRFFLSDWLIDQFTNNRYNANYYDTSIFTPWIGSSELKIFSHYPKDMIKYPTLIPEESENIAFDISYRDDNNQLCIPKQALTHILSENIKDYIRSITNIDIPDDIDQALDVLDIDSYKSVIRNNTFITDNGINILSKDRQTLRNALVACSSRKFVYQRLFVDRRSYRIKLDKRFRYCDNPKQYLLFINGRRQRQDSFLITIPKHTRPFNDLYIYTAVFVGPTDRVELFYMPYEITDINFDEDKRYELNSNGYFEMPRSMLKTPLSKDLYMFFVNGKKIPADKIIDVDTHTIRVNIETNTLHYLMVTAINMDTLPSITSYLQDEEKFSEYDSLIKYIKSRSDGINILDTMLDSHIQLSDNESDKLWMDVAKIAILNEIVRDFWVTSGYDYHDQDIVYDYDTDDYYEIDSEGRLILPALNAEPDINIVKNDISLLYFYTDPVNLMCELGNTLTYIKFYWEYSQRLNQPWNILWQTMNGVSIGSDTRVWETNPSETRDSHYKFVANTGQQFIIKEFDIDYVNGTYWGTINKDELLYYKALKDYIELSEIVAVVPNNKIEVSFKQLELESGNEAYKEYIHDNYTLIYGLTYGDTPPEEIDIWDDPSLQNIYDNSFIAICDNGERYRDLTIRKYDDSIIDGDIYIDRINARTEDDIISSLYLEDVEEMVPPEPSYIDADYNIGSEAFIAVPDDHNVNTLYQDFVLVKDIDLTIPDDNIYAIDYGHFMAITEDEHKVLRSLDSSNNVDPYADNNTDDIDINMYKSGFSAYVDDEHDYLDDLEFAIDLSPEDGYEAYFSIKDNEGSIYATDLETGEILTEIDMEDSSILPDDLVENLSALDMETGVSYDLKYEDDTLTVLTTSGDILSGIDLIDLDTGELLNNNDIASIQIEDQDTGNTYQLTKSDEIFRIIDSDGNIIYEATYRDLDAKQKAHFIDGIFADIWFNKRENTDIISISSLWAPVNGSSRTNLTYKSDEEPIDQDAITVADVVYNDSSVMAIVSTKEDSTMNDITIDDLYDSTDDTFNGISIVSEDGETIDNLVIRILDDETLEPTVNVLNDHSNMVTVTNRLYDLDLVYYHDPSNLNDLVLLSNINTVSTDNTDIYMPDITYEIDTAIASQLDFEALVIDNDTFLAFTEKTDDGDIMIFSLDDESELYIGKGIDYIDIDSNIIESEDVDTGSCIAMDIDKIIYPEMTLSGLDIDTALYEKIDNIIEIQSITGMMAKLKDSTIDNLTYETENIVDMDKPSYIEFDDDTDLSNIETGEVRYKTYAYSDDSMPGMIEYTITGFNAVDDNGNTIANDIIYMVDPVIVDNELIDPSHETFKAITANSILDNIEIEPYNEPIVTHVSDVVSYDINYGIMAIDQSNNTIKDMYIWEDPVVTNFVGMLDPTDESFKAICNNSETYNKLKYVDVDDQSKYTTTVDGPSGYNILSSGFRYVSDDGEILQGGDLQVLNDRNILLDQYQAYDVETLVNAITSEGTMDGLKYIIDQAEESPFKFFYYNESIYGSPGYITDDTDTMIDDTFWIVDNGEIESLAIDIDKYDDLRMINLSDDSITKQDFYLTPIDSDIPISIDEFDIDQPGFRISNYTDEKDGIVITPMEDLKVSANEASAIADIGILRIDDSNIIGDAIVDGTAHIIKNVLYNVDGLADMHDIMTFDIDDNIFIDMNDGRRLDKFDIEDYKNSWTNIEYMNINDPSTVIILDDGSVLTNIRYVYDMNRPDLRYYYDETDLPMMLRNLDKYLVKEPAYVDIRDYAIGNNNIFIFACPKRLVYDGYHQITEFNMPNIHSQDIIDHCVSDSNMPIYTSGKKANNKVAGIGEESVLYEKLDSMEMQFLGECEFTNDYGITETYMVWRSNGYFTRLMDGYGINMTIRIGRNNTEATIFYNRSQNNDNILNNTLDNITVIPYFKDSDFNMEPKELKPKIDGHISNVKTKSSMPSTRVVMMAANKDPEKEDKLLKEQGIFLI